MIVDPTSEIGPLSAEIFEKEAQAEQTPKQAKASEGAKSEDSVHLVPLCCHDKQLRDIESATIAGIKKTTAPRRRKRNRQKMK